jgi:myosin heavy subunit
LIDLTTLKNNLTMSWFAPETGTDTDAKVYIRDAEYAWLPATVVQSSSDDDNNSNNKKEKGDNDTNSKKDNTRVQVQIDLPSDWESTTVPCHQSKQSQSSETTTNSMLPHGQTRWISLSDYPKHQLLLQNQGILARDMAELPHLHEAAILYQVKERHVREKPYTRVGEIVVAVNPCQWIEGLYSKQEQEKYAKILVWQEGTFR